jgi:tyrosinase
LVKDNKHREYFANIRAPKYAFNGPYAVHVFMGEFSADPEARQSDRDLVGSVVVFANDIATTGCKSCHQNAKQGMVVTGAVPLTTALIERIDEVGSLDPADVEPYLTKNLHWRIHRYEVAAHPNVDRREAPGVLVAVTSVVVEHPTTPDALPVYKDWNPIPGLTAGRPTGADPTTAEGYEAPGSEL